MLLLRRGDVAGSLPVAVPGMCMLGALRRIWLPRVGAGSARNVRSRLSLLHVPLFPQATGVSAPAPVSIAPRNYIALSELT